jgi:hypothetical protein
MFLETLVCFTKYNESTVGACTLMFPSKKNDTGCHVIISSPNASPSSWVVVCCSSCLTSFSLSYKPRIPYNLVQILNSRFFIFQDGWNSSSWADYVLARWSPRGLLPLPQGDLLAPGSPIQSASVEQCHICKRNGARATCFSCTPRVGPHACARFLTRLSAPAWW